MTERPWIRLLLVTWASVAAASASVDPVITQERVREVVAAVEGRASVEERAADRISVLVELERGTDRGPLLRFADTCGGTCKYEYRLLPDVLNLRGIPRGELESLRALPGVRRVVEDRPVRAQLNDSTPLIRALQSLCLRGRVP